MLTRSRLRQSRVHLASALIAAGLMTGGPVMGVAAATPGETDSSSSTGTQSPAADNTQSAPDRLVSARQAGATARSRAGRTAPSAHRTDSQGHSASTAAAGIPVLAHPHVPSPDAAQMPSRSALSAPPASAPRVRSASTTPDPVSTVETALPSASAAAAIAGVPTPAATRQAAAPTISASIGRLLDTVDRHPSTPPDSPVNDLVAGAMLLMRRTPSPSDADTGRSQVLETTLVHANHTTSFTGWAVGSSNEFSGGYATILKIDTKNNGFSNVTRQGTAAQFADITLQGVATVSPRVSWIAGLDNSDQRGVIFRTNDGGVTWKPQAAGQQLEPLYGITAINRYKAWAVGASGSVYFTRNGGLRWTQIGSPENLHTQSTLQGVFAPSINLNGRVWVTATDDVAPQSISILYSPNTSARYLPAIMWSTTSDTTTCSASCAMLSVTGNSTGKKLFAVGGKPYTAVASVDSGRHWTQQSLPGAGGANDANSVITLDGTNAWIVADYGNTWWTENGGAQWNKVRVPGASGAFLLGVSTADNQHLWAVGGETGKGIIALSSDAGRTWEVLGGGALPDTGNLWKVSVVQGCI